MLAAHGPSVRRVWEKKPILHYNSLKARFAMFVQMKFRLGQVLATPGALEVIHRAGQEPLHFLERHAQGDWGEVDAEDWNLNDESVRDGTRILSAYRTLQGEKLWIITEAADDHGNRAATTILLPDEY
jgi:hypothetical protein